MRSVLVAVLVLPGAALALEDDFLDDTARCFGPGYTNMPEELLGPLRTGNSRQWLNASQRACPRTELSSVTSFDDRAGWNTVLHMSWRPRKRSETFLDLEVARGGPGQPTRPGALRWGIAWQSPVPEADSGAGMFNMQLLLPTFGTSRIAGAATGADIMVGLEHFGVFIHLSAMGAFFEQDDGRWLFGWGLDGTLGVSIAANHVISIIAEARANAGTFAFLRGAAGARISLGLVGVELTLVTPLVGVRPTGFEAVLALIVLPLEDFRRPRFGRYSHDYEVAGR